MNLFLSLTQARSLERVVKSPGHFYLVTFTFGLVVLTLDVYADYGQQLTLALFPWIYLGLVFVHLTSMERIQTGLVVAVATLGEVLFSVLSGVYVYRLGNLPLFVPPGHGLVYLAGLRLSQTRLVSRRPRRFVYLAVLAVIVWALLGLIVTERKDVAGAVGAAVLIIFIFRAREPLVFAGVFFSVACLEIYGTTLGNWRWMEEIPFLGVRNGNPPSGVASGYTLVDITARALAPSVLVASAATCDCLRRFRNRLAGGLFASFRFRESQVR